MADVAAISVLLVMLLWCCVTRMQGTLGFFVEKEQAIEEHNKKIAAGVDAVLGTIIGVGLMAAEPVGHVRHFALCLQVFCTYPQN